MRGRRLLAIAALAAVAAAVAAALSAGGGSPGPVHTAATAPARAAQASAASTAPRPAPAPQGPGHFAVGLRVFRATDPTRTVTLPGVGTEQRSMLVYVRYPAQGPAGANDLRDAPAASSWGPFPLIVFGHGFAVTPAPYDPLLRWWARAGYVVAAPVFPLGNEHAPGGPNESDLVNQPRDMSFVISELLLAGRTRGLGLEGIVDASRVAVAGQSDGGDTALAVAYNPVHRDPRVGAAVILSGAPIPMEPGFTFPQQGPALLAVQGTADTVNLPTLTEQFFAAAPRPKYLLRLPGAEHLPPYTTEEPQLSIVERVSTHFLDAYLRHVPGAQRRMLAAGSVPEVAEMVAAP